MESIFSVSNADLSRLNEREAIEVLAELLWAEATSMGIGKHLVSIPKAIFARDGGVDAEVKNPEGKVGQGVIKEGLTRYQVNTGDFSLSNAGIRDILFNNAGELKPRIKSCLDANGTLVIVLFGSDSPDEKVEASQRFVEELAKKDKKYLGAKVEVWRQTNLVGFISKYPSLALKINGRNDLPFQSHDGWSRNADMGMDYKAGPAQEKLLGDIGAAFHDASGAIHVRILGEPGIGKTRLVFEATKRDVYRPLTICCGADAFINSPLLTELTREDNSYEVFLVIDECNPDNSVLIWNRLHNLGPRVRLVTIFNDFAERARGIKYFEAPPLPEEQISQIIEKLSQNLF